MKNLLIFGINGKMGRILSETALEDGGYNIYGYDLRPNPQYPTFCSAAEISIQPDVIIDFSIAEALDAVLSCALKFRCPLVLATTGYSKAQEALIADASKSIPIFKSGNMSVGVNAILSIVTEAAKRLIGFDIEIVEKHHNQKADAPSGTAFMLAQAANIDGGKEYSYGRSGKCPRKPAEIGIHAVRGGTIAGEHDVIFAGSDETITISHQALSKRIFATGALKAAKAILSKPAGLYSFQTLD